MGVRLNVWIAKSQLKEPAFKPQFLQSTCNSLIFHISVTVCIRKGQENSYLSVYSVGINN